MPGELKLNTPPTMPQARSYTFKVQSSDITEYAVGNSTPIQIDIPRLSRSYLRKDSYIKFRLKIANNTGASIDLPSNPTFWLAFDQVGALGIFNRITVYDYLGSTVLEDVQNIPQLLSIELQTKGNHATFLNSLAVTCGTSNTAKSLDGNTICGGVLINDPTTFNNNAFYEYEFCIPLISFLGVRSPTYAPLHNGYTIMMIMNDPSLFLVSNNSAIASKLTFTINNVYAYLQVLELGPTAEDMVLRSLNEGPFVISSETFRCYTSSTKSSTNQTSIPLNLNVASLTGVIAAQYHQSIAPWITRNLTCRCRNFLQYFRLRYGSSTLPSTSGIQCGSNPGSRLVVPGTFWDLNGNLPGDNEAYLATDGGFTEAYVELLKCFDIDMFDRSLITPSLYGSQLGSDISIGDQASLHLFTEATFATGYNTVDQMYAPDICAYPTQFAVGLSTKLTQGNGLSIVSGLNTNGMYTVAEFAYDERALADNLKQAATILLWARYNAFISVVPGLATTVAY